jgi:hypothetical protein
MELSSRSQPSADKKPPIRAEEKLLLSRRDVAQLLSISQRALDYLVATRRLPTIQSRLRGNRCSAHWEQDKCSFLTLNRRVS